MLKIKKIINNNRIEYHIIRLMDQIDPRVLHL